MTILAAALLALAAHEVSHYTAARLLGYPARLGLRSCRWGSDAVASPPRHRFLVAYAGPAANALLALALILAGAPWPAAAMNAAMLVGNLLPLRGSDGRNMLRALRSA